MPGGGEGGQQPQLLRLRALLRMCEWWQSDWWGLKGGFWDSV